MIFCRKKQKTNAKSGRTKVADWQDVGVENLRHDWCPNGSTRQKNGAILRTDFCEQSSYSSIDVLPYDSAVIREFTVTSVRVCSNFCTYYLFVIP